MLLGVFTWLWGVGLAVERSGVLMPGPVVADWVEVDGHCGGLLSAYGLGCGERLLSGVFTGPWVLGLTVVRLGVLMFGQEKVLQLMADGVEMVGQRGALLSAFELDNRLYLLSVLMVSGGLNGAKLKLGLSHSVQNQTTSEFPNSSYVLVLIRRHFLWNQLSQVSQHMALSAQVTFPMHRGQGYCVASAWLVGPGLREMSHDAPNSTCAM